MPGADLDELGVDVAAPLLGATTRQRGRNGQPGSGLSLGFGAVPEIRERRSRRSPICGRLSSSARV